MFMARWFFENRQEGRAAGWRHHEGAGDWYYRYDPLSARAFIMGKDRSIRSYSVEDNFSIAGTGVALGTLPLNLSNLQVLGVELNTLGWAKKRDAACSFGVDTVLLDAKPAPSSLKRLTNRNGSKQVSAMR